MKVKITKCPHADNGLQVEGNQATPISDNMVMLGGKPHEQGGTDISYNGQQVEAEKGEPVSIGDKGEAIVWGNMTVPGTNKKFKTVAKDLGEQEAKYSKLDMKATDLLADNNPEDKFQRLGWNSGRVMQLGALYGQTEVNTKKSRLAKIQRALLETAHENNLDPQELSKGNIKKAKKGAFMDYQGVYADDGTDLGIDPTKRKTKKYKTMSAEDIQGFDVQHPNIPGPNVQAPAAPYRGMDLSLTDNAVDNTMDTIPQLQGADNLGVTRPFIPSNAQNLKLTQILPEIYGFANNREVPVAMQKYVPQQYVPYQMSFQDQLNDNTATANARRRLLVGNPVLASAAAADEYEANNRVRGAEFRTNQGIQAETINRNVATNNEAQLRNLQLSDLQFTRQAEAKSRTKEINQAIVNSIASKYQQNDLNNKRLAAYENLYDYRFVDTNRDGVPDQATYYGPDAQFNYGSQGNSGGNSSIDPYSRTVIQKTQGGVTTRTITPSGQDIQGKNLRNQKLQESRNPLKRWLIENFGSHRP